LAEPVTKEQVKAEIDNFLSFGNPSVSVKMILSKPFNLIDGCNIEIPILNKVETSMVQSTEQDLLNHLRKTLRNSIRCHG